MGKRRFRVSPAMVVACAALFVALGGTALAGVIISSNSQVARNTISGHRPPAGDRANIIARSVGNADLSPELQASLKPHCPADLRPAADICFEDSLRSGATLANALQACAGAGLRLPTLAELTLAFDHLGAPQPSQWVSTQYFDTNGNATSLLGTLLGENASRVIQFGTDDALTHTQPYRCVTSPAVG